MFERFTDRARRVVVLAQEEARLFGHEYIGTGHLLLGLIKEGDGVGATAFGYFEVPIERVRELVSSFAGVERAFYAEGSVGEASEIEDLNESDEDTSAQNVLLFSSQARAAIEQSLRETLVLGHSYVGTEHILLGLTAAHEGVVVDVLGALDVTSTAIRERVRELLSGFASVEAASAPVVAPSLGRDLTTEARRGMLDPVIGRETELQRVLQVLSLRRRVWPTLTGEGDVSVLAVIEALAQSIVRGDVPSHLDDCDLFLVDVEAVALEKGISDLQECLLATLGEKLAGSLVVVTGLANHLATRPDAVSGVLRVMREPGVTGGASLMITATSEDYREVLSRDSRLLEHLELIEVAEPTEVHAIEMLKGLRERYEAHHRIRFSDESLETAVRLAKQFIQDAYLPESAATLLDEAGAQMRIKRMDPPPEVREFSEKIAEVRHRKESAIDGQDFEAAARLRDEEKQLILRKSEAEKVWRASELDEVVEVDGDFVVALVAQRVGRSVDEVRRALGGQATVAGSSSLPSTDSFRLLNDVPVEDEKDDLLAVKEVASEIAGLLRKAPTPFAFAIDASWGMGKSTLLRQIDQLLPEDDHLAKTHFNAWTAQGDNALEALIRSVLSELDQSVVRRAWRQAAKRRKTLTFARVVFALFGRFFGITRLVDEIWDQLGGDAKSRNELKSAISGMLGDWVAQGGETGRTLIVFVDDLDRCSDDVVVDVCEAVKLYLDAPGLIFVMACDMSVVARGVGEAARGGQGEGRTYLEKIVQVAYRLPPPNEAALEALVWGYARDSGTASLISKPIVDILVQRSGGNPRRVKRILNSFVLENQLADAWSSAPLDRVQLISVIITQHLYPDFFDWMVDPGVGVDPVGDFLDYASFRRKASTAVTAGDRWWAEAVRTFRRHELAVPNRRDQVDSMAAHVDAIDGAFPDGFAGLAGDSAFVTLLEGLGGAQARQAVRSQLVRRPLQALRTLSQEELSDAVTESVGPTV